MKEREFEIVSDDLRMNDHARPQWMTAVFEGKTVFLPGANQQKMSGGYSDAFRRKGLRLRTHVVERDGVRGIVLWTEPR